ncbi:Ubiquitin carboxyl-terminal hydrolase 25 [Gonapodya sp. JEL0774]|nr:Ubiquitin carboxyl-terminal hydrolase 25 [Gonapodya sp. JEL0774]
MEENKSRLATLWDELSTDDSKYALHAVLLHEGEAMFGHYWIYIHDPVGPNGPRWIKFNDTLVTVVSEEEVLRDRGGNANAYCLVYVRQQDRADIVSVCTRNADLQNEYKCRYPALLASLPPLPDQITGTMPVFGPELPPDSAVLSTVDASGDMRMTDSDGWELPGGLATEA